MYWDGVITLWTQCVNDYHVRSVVTMFSVLCILRISLSCVGLVMLFCGIQLLCLFRKAILSNTFRHEYKFFYGKSCHHQYSVTVFLQMSRGTRGAKQRANMNPPPPPPPPNLAELMQMMVENQRMLTVGYFKRKQKNPQAHEYRCSFHPGVFQSIDFPQGTWVY